MPEPEMLPDEPDAAAAIADDDNGRIAALLLVAILVVTFVAIAAGQAFAAQGACGEPGHGDALISQPWESGSA